MNKSYSAELKEYLCSRTAMQASLIKGSKDKKISKCCAKAFVYGSLIFSKKRNSSAVMTFESGAFSELLTYLLIQMFNIAPIVNSKASRGKTFFEVEISGEGKEELLKSIENPYDLSDYTRCGECSEYFLRGAFLSCGTVTDPETSYHAEFVTSDSAKAEALFAFLLVEDMDARLIKRRNNFIVYIKGSERVASFFNKLGAQKYALDIIEKSFEKEIKNNINRSCNCENANTKKTVDAFIEVREAIDKIKKQGTWNTLSKELRDVGELRLKYPDASLSELSMLDERITLSRSGLNHRLQKIVKIAKELD